MPSARTAAKEYARAVETQDVDALWAMMSESARESMTKEQLRGLLARDHEQLKARAQAATSEDAEVKGEAALYLTEGQVVPLSLDGGEFWIMRSGVLPPESRTPEQAAIALRDALRSGDSARLGAVLTRQSRRQLELNYEELEESLGRLELAVVDIKGDRASIRLDNGHTVSLRLEDGVWRVEEIR